MTNAELQAKLRASLAALRAKPCAPSRPYGSTVSRSVAASIAIATFVGEPCRICGVPVTIEAVDNAVYVGVSGDQKARCAHADCWATYRGDPSSWSHV